MNEHVRKGNAALEIRDFRTALVEYQLALSDLDQYTQRIARNRISELACDPIRTLCLLELKEAIIPATTSGCCRAKSIFVLSREGGFVALACTRCYKSFHAYPFNFPSLEHCGRKISVSLEEKNYCYRCETCKKGFRVADHVPSWRGLLPYHGLGAPGDAEWR